MENDFDKILRDKLRNHKADYNSADWEQMEAMLPEKSRKPYLLAALLLLLLGSVALWMGTKSSVESGIVQQENSGREAVNSNRQDNSANEPLSNQQQSQQSQADQSPNDEKQVSFLEEKAAREKVFEKKEKAASDPGVQDRKVTLHSFSEGGVEKSPKGEQVQLQSKKEAADAGVDSPGKRNSKRSDEANAGKLRSEEIATTATSAVSSFSAVSANQEKHAGIIREERNESVFALNTIDADLLASSGNEEVLAPSMIAADPATSSLKKKKKQVASFAMGAGAGINWSFIESARWTKPGYSVDIAEELMFINRIGFAFTQGYSKRIYDGGKYPYIHGLPECPSSYTTEISSAEFGIDLKANLVHQPKWNWYVKAGVVNTIKVKEEYTYHYEEVDTVTPPLPPKTNFNGSFEGMTFDTNSLQQADPIYPADIAISGNKRFHLAFHFATGFDVVLTPKINMQLEAGHSFTQPTVGEDDKRLQSFGINGRVLYCFGR